MNNKFCGFYTPKEENYKEIWNHSKTLFIFDTNTLLNLYRCEEQTKDDIISVMKALSSRSWYPFQVCLEYQRNRINVISQSIKSLEKFKKSINSLVNSTDNALSEAQVKKHLYTSLSEEVSVLKDSLASTITSFINDKIESRIKSKEKIKTSDTIRKALDDIIGDNCGDIPDQTSIDEINKEGASRYSKKIPPGYMDEKTKGDAISFYNGVEFQDKYGDLYLWKEILEISKKHDDHNIIFVTDDSKKDWWYSHDNKIIGPSEPLQTEIYFNSNIKSFRMINHSNFLYEASKYLDNLQIKQSSVDDIKDISSENSKELNDEYHVLLTQGIRNGKRVKRMQMSKYKDLNTWRKYFINTPSTHENKEDIIATYNHFREKYKELHLLFVEVSEMVDFNYDIESDSEIEYKHNLELLDEIRVRLNEFLFSLDLFEEQINESETLYPYDHWNILLSNISTQSLTIKSLIDTLSGKLL